MIEQFRKGRDRSTNITDIGIKIRMSLTGVSGNISKGSDGMEETRCAFKIVTGKPTGKRLLGRPRRRWEDNIRMDLEEIGINAGNWVDSAQNRDYWRALVNAALNLRVS